MDSFEWLTRFVAAAGRDVPRSGLLRSAGFSPPFASSVHFVDFFGDIVEAEDDLVGFSAGGVRGESKRAIFDNM